MLLGTGPGRAINNRHLLTYDYNAARHAQADSTIIGISQRFMV